MGIGKLEKAVFLAVFDNFVKYAPYGWFQAKNHVFVIFKLKVGRKIYMTH